MHERGEQQDDFQLPDGRDPSEALFQALSRTVANRWKALPEDKRAPYHARAKEEMKKYREKMDEYNQNLINSSALAHRLAVKQKEQLDESEGKIKTANREEAKPVATQGEPAGVTSNPSSAFYQLRPNASADRAQSLTPSQYAAASSFQSLGQSSTTQPFGLPNHPSALQMTPQERAQLLQSLNMGGTDLYSRMAPIPATSTLHSFPGIRDSNLVARLQLERARLNQLLHCTGSTPTATGPPDPSRGLYATSNSWGSLGLGVDALYGISSQPRGNSAAAAASALMMERLQAEQRQANEAALRVTASQRQMSLADELALQQLLRDHPELVRSHFGHRNK